MTSPGTAAGLGLVSAASWGGSDQPPKTPADSPFRRFTVSCLKCGSYKLRVVGEFDSDAGDTKVFLFCPAYRVEAGEAPHDFIRFLQAWRESGVDKDDVAFFTISWQAEQSADEIFETDAKLNELSAKIRAIEQREGLDELDEFDPDHPETPADWKVLDAKSNRRFQAVEKIRDARFIRWLRRHGELDMADLFANDRAAFDRRREAGRCKLFGPTRFIPARVTDNRWNNPEYVRVLENLTGSQKRAWLDGDWDIAAGQYFTTLRREVHVVEDFDDSRAVEWFAALDYGFAHYTVVLLGCRDGDGNIFVVDEHAERLWLPQRHAAAVKAMLARHKIGERKMSVEDLKRFPAWRGLRLSRASRPTCGTRWRAVRGRWCGCAQAASRSRLRVQVK